MQGIGGSTTQRIAVEHHTVTAQQPTDLGGQLEVIHSPIDKLAPASNSGGRVEISLVIELAEEDWVTVVAEASVAGPAGAGQIVLEVATFLGQAVGTAMRSVADLGGTTAPARVRAAVAVPQAWDLEVEASVEEGALAAAVVVGDRWNADIRKIGARK